MLSRCCLARSHRMSHSVEPLLPVETKPAEARPSRWLWWLQPKVALPLTLFVLLVLSPFLYRAYRIAEVPDIDEPFDLEAFGSVEIAPAENAMTHYALAVKMLHQPTHFSFGDEMDKFRADGWPAASANLRKWLDDNQPALAEWRKGTVLERSQEVALKNCTWSTLLPVTQECRQLAELARLQAERCLHEGDSRQAWVWLNAALRSSRHVQQHGVLIQRLVGSAIQSLTAEGIVRWSAHSDVAIDHLRNAISDVNAADQMTPPISDTLKADYVTWCNQLRAEDELWEVAAMDSPEDARVMRFRLWWLGEPERSQRVMRHAYQNVLAEIDKLPRDRTPTTPGFSKLFDLPAGPNGQLAGRDVEKLIGTSHLAAAVVPGFEQLDESTRLESARRVALPAAIGCQIYRRLHGDWPTRLEELVPDILPDAPIDPLGKVGDLLRLKRDGDDLIIYSVGPNGVDDGAQIDLSTSPLLDVGFRLKRTISQPSVVEPAQEND